MAEQLACYIGDLEIESALRAEVPTLDGATVAIAIVRGGDGNYYAIGDECSHGEVSLSEGEVDGCEVECWAHGARFDIRTGEVTELPALKPVKAYPIRIDGERVLVDIDSPITSESLKENA